SIFKINLRLSARTAKLLLRTCSAQTFMEPFPEPQSRGRLPQPGDIQLEWWIGQQPFYVG
ncbi:MAG TPA: hypothetical protein VEI95_11340, partial [Acidobacteriota bacterium]|nr:hypothetical protein [Acidobacteriota bacterium]